MRLLVDAVRPAVGEPLAEHCLAVDGELTRTSGGGTERLLYGDRVRGGRARIRMIAP